MAANRLLADCSEGLLAIATLNPFVPDVTFLYPRKTLGNPTVFWCFQGVERGCIGNEWVHNKVIQFYYKDTSCRRYFKSHKTFQKLSFSSSFDQFCKSEASNAEGYQSFYMEALCLGENKSSILDFWNLNEFLHWPIP